jgi:hypothetical protein
VGPLVIRMIRFRNDAWLQVQHAAAPDVICINRFGPYDYDLAMDSFDRVIERTTARQAMEKARDG